EHHLRIDGSGYPPVSRPSLNLGTMLCSIADVYDAMRSQRKYQQAFPSERILEVLKRNDGTQFDQHLVRRITQLIGIYPAGNLVRLNTGEIAVVVLTRAAYPYSTTVTCAGHATIGTGAFPHRHGMVQNVWWDRNRERLTRCTEDPASNAISYGKDGADDDSARNLMVPTFANVM